MKKVLILIPLFTFLVSTIDAQKKHVITLATKKIDLPDNKFYVTKG